MTTTRTHPRPPSPPPTRATRRAAARASGLQQRRRHRARHQRRWVGWAVAGVLAVAAVVAVVLGGQSSSPGSTGLASDFTLASTSGGEVALSDFRGRNVLLYFNEGVGCDACFYQTAMLETDEAFTALDVPLVPIVMNPAAQVQGELDRFGIGTPYLVDADGSVARAYDTLGTGHHADLPGHSLVLVGPDGIISWRGDYPGMWIEPAEVASTVSNYLDQPGQEASR